MSKSNVELNENKLISLAEQLAEKWMTDALKGDGKCPSQVVVEYLKRGGATGERVAAKETAQADMMNEKAKALKSVEQSNDAEQALESLLRYKGKK